MTVFSCPFPLAAQFSFLPTHVHGKPVPLSDVFWDTWSLGPAALPSCCVSQACTHAHTHPLLLDAPTPLPCCPPALGVGLPLFLDGQLPWVSSWAWCCGTQVGRVRGGGTNWRDIRTAGGGQRPPEGEMQSWPLTGAGIWVGDTAGPQQGPQGAQTLREAGALLALLGVRPHAHSPGEMKVHGCVGCVCVIGWALKTLLLPAYDPLTSGLPCKCQKGLGEAPLLTFLE